VFVRGQEATCAVQVVPDTVSSPWNGGKAVQHFCPECSRDYNCNIERLREFSGLMPHGIQCGTPYKWRCPECARKDTLLYGKSEAFFTDFAYTSSAA
jgi:hypothetical protein